MPGELPKGRGNLLLSPLCTRAERKHGPLPRGPQRPMTLLPWALDQQGKNKNAVLNPALFTACVFERPPSPGVNRNYVISLSQGGPWGIQQRWKEVHGYRSLSKKMPDLWLPELRKSLCMLCRQRMGHRTGSRHQLPPSSVSQHGKYNQIWVAKKVHFILSAPITHA